MRLTFFHLLHQLKCIIFEISVDHFNTQILDKYVESGTKCKICRYHDSNLNQLTRHVALQHEKIREYIPAPDGDALFNNVNKQLTNNTSNNATVKSEGTPTSFTCYICSKSSRTRGELRQHVFSHLRHEIQSKYYPDNVIDNCLECDYKSSTADHVLTHLALKHRKILEFVPKEMSEYLFSNNNTNNSNKGTSTNTSTTPTASSVSAKLVNCVRCKSTLESKEALREHLETCNWKCDACGITLRDPKGIKKHRATCGQTKDLDNSGT